MDQHSDMSGVQKQHAELGNLSVKSLHTLASIEDELNEHMQSDRQLRGRISAAKETLNQCVICAIDGGVATNFS